METIIPGELRILMAIKLQPTVTNALIQDAMMSKMSFHSLYNSASCGTSQRVQFKIITVTVCHHKIVLSIELEQVHTYL